MGNRPLRSLLLRSSFVALATLVILSATPLLKLPGRLPQTLRTQRLLDRNGTLLKGATSAQGERLHWTPLKNIPLSLQQAFLLAEDQKFYQHLGVDIGALVRATWQLLTNFRGVSGASTITMQTVRLHWPKLSGLKGKLSQMFQAVRVELYESKQSILEHYLNLVPFAYQVAGVHQACRYFFGKSCSRLSLAESAALAIIPRNPSFYTHNLHKLKHQRNLLLKKLHPQHSLLLTQALTEPLELKFQRMPTEAHHFIQQVTQHYPEQSQVQTTLDLNLQKKVQSLLQQQVSGFPKLGNAGAVLVVHNPSSEVRAYVGSPSFFGAGHGMFDAVQARRSPGSTLKPFVYALALEKGWNLASVLPDIPMTFKTGNGTFTPRNYSGKFSGPQQLRFALAGSLNIPVFHLTSKLGVDTVLHFLRDLGFQLDKEASYYGAGVSLGNGEVSLWELVQAYHGLSRGGTFQKLKLVPDNNSPQLQLSAETAFLISDVLSDSDARSLEFGRGGPLEFAYDVAVKTGTSNSFRDQWTIGYTPDYTVGVWKGNADGSPLKAKVGASRGAALLFREVIQILEKNSSSKAFQQPKTITSQLVCSLSGQLPTPHCPHRRLEFFTTPTLPKQPCPFHHSLIAQSCQGGKEELQYTKLPDEYLSWAESSNVLTYAKIQANSCWKILAPPNPQLHKSKPYLLTPLSGRTFAWDPRIPATHQKIRLELSHFESDIELWVNGTFFQYFTSKTLDWPLQKGLITFALKQKQAHFSNVTITVH